MADNTTNDQSNAEKDPENWTTGDEPMTGAQRSYIETMAGEANEKLPDLDTMTKADASELIEKLQQKTNRGE